MYGTKFIKVSLLFLILACARKMPPPSPDRFPPGIVDKGSLYRDVYYIKFNEPLDTSSINRNNFIIEDGRGKKLPHLISFFRNSSSILIYSRDDGDKVIIEGQVSDLHKNVKRFRVSIKNTHLRDTIPPWILAAPQGWVRRGKEGIFITFSEPVDTTLFVLNYRSIPLLKCTYKWSKGWDKLSIDFPDIEDSTLYSLYIGMEVFDMAGNRLDTFFIINPYLHPPVRFRVFLKNRAAISAAVRKDFFTVSTRDYIMVPADSLMYNFFSGYDYGNFFLMGSLEVEDDSLSVALDSIERMGVEEILKFAEKE